MDKLSDIVPLLIIIGSLIVSVIQSSNKKKRQQQDMRKTMLPKGVYDQKESEPDPVIPQFKPGKEIRQKKDKVRLQPTVDTFNPEVKRVVAPVSEMQNFQDPEPVNSGFVLNFSDMDELKRAVIYSEIINRKEF